MFVGGDRGGPLNALYLLFYLSIYVLHHPCGFFRRNGFYDVRRRVTRRGRGRGACGFRNIDSADGGQYKCVVRAPFYKNKAELIKEKET